MKPIKMSSILRRGADGLSAPQLSSLLENPDKVRAIIEEINARSAVFVEIEKSAKARLCVAEEAEAKAAASLEKVAEFEAHVARFEKGKAAMRKALHDFKKESDAARAEEEAILGPRAGVAN